MVSESFACAALLLACGLHLDIVCSTKATGSYRQGSERDVELVTTGWLASAISVIL